MGRVQYYVHERIGDHVHAKERTKLLRVKFRSALQAGRFAPVVLPCT